MRSLQQEIQASAVAGHPSAVLLYLGSGQLPSRGVVPEEPRPAEPREPGQIRRQPREGPSNQATMEQQQEGDRVQERLVQDPRQGTVPTDEVQRGTQADLREAAVE